MNPKATIRLRAQAYGGSVKAPLRVIVPIVVAGMTAGVVALTGQTPAFSKFLPLTGLPVIALMIWMFASMRMREVELEFKERRLQVSGWASKPADSQIVGFEFVPWVLPGVGSTHGTAVRIRLSPPDGATWTLVVAAAGQPLPGHAQGEGSTSNPDCFLTAADFAALLRALEVEAIKPAEHHEASTLTLAVVRYEGGFAAFRSMVPWFLTIAFLGLFGGLFGETLTQKAWGLPVLWGVILGAIGFGIYRTFVGARREKPHYRLLLSDATLSLSAPNSETIWSERTGAVRVGRETYVYRTKYGSHRIPVLVLLGSSGELRLGVWDSTLAFAFAGSKEGRRPKYLVGTPDWSSLLSKVMRATAAGRQPPTPEGTAR